MLTIETNNISKTKRQKKERRNSPFFRPEPHVGPGGGSQIQLEGGNVSCSIRWEGVK